MSLKAFNFIGTYIKKSLIEHCDVLCEDIKNHSEMFVQHINRLLTVRENRDKPETENLAEPWDSQSDASSVSSLRTGHTSTSRSSKNTRKTVRKMWSLKEGNPREEQALLNSLTTIIQSTEKYISMNQNNILIKAKLVFKKYCFLFHYY